MGFFTRVFRIHRAGNIAVNSSKLKELEDDGIYTKREKAKANALRRKIAKDQERNKIAKERNSRSINKTNTYNLASGNTKKVGVNDVKASIGNKTYKTASESKTKSQPKKKK